MFINEVKIGDKTYDLHLKFTFENYNNTKATDMGYLTKELCYPSGEYTKYIESEEIVSQHSMTRKQADMIMELAKNFYGNAQHEKNIAKLDEDIQLRMFARDYLSKLLEVQSA